MAAEAEVAAKCGPDRFEDSVAALDLLDRLRVSFTITGSEVFPESSSSSILIGILLPTCISSTSIAIGGDLTGDSAMVSSAGEMSPAFRLKKGWIFFGADECCCGDVLGIDAVAIDDEPEDAELGGVCGLDTLIETSKRSQISRASSC